MHEILIFFTEEKKEIDREIIENQILPKFDIIYRKKKKHE